MYRSFLTINNVQVLPKSTHNKINSVLDYGLRKDSLWAEQVSILKAILITGRNIDSVIKSNEITFVD